ncbi:MAG: NAD(+) synthase [Clostridia bacterium]|nr:NAD(+) synthase [Clostridia bacterium]
MKDGFVKVKAVSPYIELGNPDYNANLVIEEIEKADKQGVSILVFPELCLCGATLGGLTSSEIILKGCEKALDKILNATHGTNPLAFVGLPVGYLGQAYSSVAVIRAGVIQAIIPKRTSLSGYTLPEKTLCDYADNTFSIDRFANAFSPVTGTVLVHRCENMKNLVVGCEIGIDSQIGADLVANGATIIVNPCACYETVTSEEDISDYAKVKSKRLCCGYVICNPSLTESTSKAVYSSHNIICENGDVLAESIPLVTKKGECVSEIDVNYLVNKRRQLGKKTGFDNRLVGSYFELEDKGAELTRYINPYPFLSTGPLELSKKCDRIMEMESFALARRLESSRSKALVIGISGGLDSTLALLTCCDCVDYLEWDRKQIIAVTMPCFGTTSRTKNNAIALCKSLGVTLKEVDISEAVSVHLRDIGHDLENKNVTFENAQARERTQVLMDIANETGGIVIGTGNMSEGALGWSTYNGDQMSMYNVNAGIPKTLVKKLVEHAIAPRSPSAQKILKDILDTPISPELLPHKDGEIEQKTEDLVGPYDLHDFFLYNMIGRGFMPSKVYRLANIAFEDKFDKETIYKWLERFIKRFFTQQFKRTATPDGIAIGSVSLGKFDFQMPSDVSCQIYLDNLKTVIE